MKFKITRSKFLDGLKTVQNIVAGKGSLPILQNVLIEANGKELKMTTTDLDISIKSVCECEVMEHGISTLPVKLLCNSVSKAGEGEIEVEIDAKERASITAGSAKFKLAGMPESEYPEGYYTTVEFIPENGMTYSVDTLRTIHVETEGDQLTVSDSSAEAGSPADMILMITGYRSNNQMAGCQVIENVTGVTEETITVTGDFIKVFFLKPGTYAPLFESIVL